MLIETNNVDCAKELVQIKSLLGTPVTSYIQTENITSRFALHNIDPEISLVDLGTELQESNPIKIMELRRFTTRHAGSVKPSETVLVTIFGTQLPVSVKFFYISEKIKLFYDRPRQCSKCWHFDHVLAKCSSEVVCRKCSGNHLLASCNSSTSTCTNCKGQHEATDSHCPFRLKEFQILKFKADNHIPITEARRRFRIHDQKSFAAVAKSSAAPPPAVPPPSELDSLLSDFLKKAQEALTKMLQQQLTIFQNHLSLMLQQHMETTMQISSGSTLATPRETVSAQTSSSPPIPPSDSLLHTGKRARLNNFDSSSLNLISKSQSKHEITSAMSVDSG